MREKILKLAVSLGRRIGSIGMEIRAWIEHTEWKYLNLPQRKYIKLPKDRMLCVNYDRKGSFIRVAFWQWVTLPNGKRDVQYIREAIEIPFEPTEKVVVEA